LAAIIEALPMAGVKSKGHPEGGGGWLDSFVYNINKLQPRPAGTWENLHLRMA